MNKKQITNWPDIHIGNYEGMNASEILMSWAEDTDQHDYPVDSIVKDELIPCFCDVCQILLPMVATLMENKNANSKI